METRILELALQFARLAERSAAERRRSRPRRALQAAPAWRPQLPGLATRPVAPRNARDGRAPFRLSTGWRSWQRAPPRPPRWRPCPGRTGLSVRYWDYERKADGGTSGGARRRSREIDEAAPGRPNRIFPQNAVKRTGRRLPLHAVTKRSASSRRAGNGKDLHGGQDPGAAIEQSARDSASPLPPRRARRRPACRVHPGSRRTCPAPSPSGRSVPMRHRRSIGSWEAFPGRPRSVTTPPIPWLRTRSWSTRHPWWTWRSSPALSRPCRPGPA